MGQDAAGAGVGGDHGVVLVVVLRHRRVGDDAGLAARQTQAQPGDFAVLIPSFHWRPFTYYAGRDLVAFEDELWLPNDDLDWRAQFAYAAQGHHRIWLI